MGGKNNFFRKPGGTMFSGPKLATSQISQTMLDAENAAIKRQSEIASGIAPSIAQQQLGQATDQQSRQAMAMAASQRGSSNPALAFRQAQIGNQQMGLENAQAGAIMGEQERRQADQFIAQQAAAQRGVALQQSMANQQADTAQRGQNLGMISGLGGAALGASSKSDENAKENIEPAKDSANEIETFMNAIKEYNYNYKSKKDGTGDKTGVMAQDLEKTKVGKTMVDQDASGQKVVDTNKAIGAILAGMADLNKKIKKMEK